VTDLQDRLTTALAARYAIERELGRGGMATVFLARDLAHDRDVALKVLHPDLAVAVGADRFRREIDIASRLQHPHILPLWDSGEAAGSLYYVMPYLRGESLRARIDRERQLPVDESIQLACEVAEALSYAHAQDVVHRDIKPENIMLEDGHAVVADFGIARAVSASGEQKLTQTGVTLGTPTYMSPEQAFAEKAIDGRSDVYSLGCVLFEMLAGQPPFSGPNAQAIMARHTMEQVPSITIVRQTVPDYVEDAIFRALAKSRADRFTTADELIVALRAPGPRTGPRRTQRLGAVERRHRKVRRMVYSAAAAVPLLTAGWAGWHFYLRPSPVGAAPPNAAETTLAVRKVAVLYFDDLSSGATLGPVADGLTEGLIDQLADVKQLDVTSRNGVAPYRGRDVEPDSIARALGVGTLVRGSVELGREGSYQVTVRLVDAATGVDLDRAAFRQPAGSVLALRDSLSSKVAEFLRKRIGNEVELRETRAGTLNVQAWLLAQRAEKLRKQSDSLWQADQAAAAMRNLDAADSAVAAAEALDPSYDEPTVQRAAIAARRARLSADAEGTGRWTKVAMAHADRVLQRNPRHAEALQVRGAARYMRYLRGLANTHGGAGALLDSAEQDLIRAVELKPGLASAWSYLSHLYMVKTNWTDAKLAAQRAYEEDAYLSAADDVIFRLYLASYQLEQFTEAQRWCREGLQRFPANPNFTLCRFEMLGTRAVPPDVPLSWKLADSLVQMTPAAGREYKRLEVNMGVAAVLARAQLADSARRVAERSRGTPHVDEDGDLLWREAFVHLQLGDRDEAIRLLKHYLTGHPDHREGFAKDNSWWWRDLRDDPRFKALVGIAQ
jgi:serine/threonine-protein kinase